MEFTEIKVCTDCIVYIANGDLPEEDHLAEQVQSAPLFKTHHVAYGGEDLGFYWSPCQCCQSPLGGERFQAFATPWKD